MAAGIILGTDQGEVLEGTGAGETLRGMGGDDLLKGNGGGDTFVYARGDGHDVIDAGIPYAVAPPSRLVLQGIAPADLRFRQDGADLVLLVPETAAGAGDAGSVRLLANPGAWNDIGVKTIDFDGGTSWTLQDAFARAVAVQQTAGDDVVRGTGFADVLAGGRGDDYLHGNGGGDTFVYNRGDGHDVVDAGIPYAVAPPSTLVLHGISPGEVTFDRPGSDLVLVVPDSAPGAGDGGSVRIQANRMAWDDMGVQSIVFDDGTTWSMRDAMGRALASQQTPGNDVVNGTPYADVIQGGRGDDVLHGGGGGDTFVYRRGDGHDVIDESLDNATDGGDNRISFQDIASTDVTVARVGDDYLLRIAETSPGAGDAGSVLIKASPSYFNDLAIREVSFSDGVSIDQAQMRAMAAVEQPASLHVVQGTDGNDLLRGETGNDVLRGGYGADTYRYEAGDGRVVIDESVPGFTNPYGTDVLLIPDHEADGIRVTHVGNDVRLEFVGAAARGVDGTWHVGSEPASVTIAGDPYARTPGGIEKTYIGAGTVWTLDDLRYKAFHDDGSRGGDVYFDVIDQHRNLWGGTDDTTYTIRGGYGDINVRDHGGDDRFVFEGFSKDQVTFEINAGKSGIDFVMHDAAGNAVGRATLEQGLTTDIVERFVFSDGILTNADVRGFLFGPSDPANQPGTPATPGTPYFPTMPEIPDSGTAGDDLWYITGSTVAAASRNPQFIVDDGGNDTLLFHDLAKSQVSMSVNEAFNGIDFLMHDASGAPTGHVTVVEGLGSGAMETLQFTDGTMSLAEVQQRLFPGHPSEAVFA